MSLARIVLSVCTFWLWIPLMALSHILYRAGSRRAATDTGMAALWLSAIPYNVQ